MTPKKFWRWAPMALPVALVLMAAVIIQSCRSNMNNDPTGVGPLSKIMHAATASSSASGSQVNLVADLASYSPVRVDPNLMNAWGIAINPNNGIVWISANHSGVAVVYNQNGDQVRMPVTIPTPDSSAGGAPTGVVFNSTTQFMIPSTSDVSKIIFSTEDGTILAWSSGNSAKIVVDRSSVNAVYKGLALAWDGGSPFLYATNFKGNAVEVFDGNFRMVTSKPFHDPDVPAGFAPFSIESIDGMLYVTYALQKEPDHMDDQKGPGNGFVDIYTTGGMLVERFASRGTLNSPWGLVQVNDDRFGDLKGAILVGDFGDGRVNIFSKHGKFRGQLSDTSGNPIEIKGLWGLAFSPGSANGEDQGGGDDQQGMHISGDQGHGTLAALFFTAGPNDENDGIFGTLSLHRKNDKGDDDQGNGQHGEDEGDDSSGH